MPLIGIRPDPGAGARPQMRNRSVGNPKDGEARVTKRILVLGNGLQAPLAIARSMGRNGAEVHLASSDLACASLSSRFIAAAHALPSSRAASGEWLLALSDLIRRYDYDLIFPTNDSTLVLLDQHGEALGRERLAIPNSEAFATFTDKERTRELARKLDVPVASGRGLRSGESAAALAREFGLPLAIKPQRSYVPGLAAAKLSVTIAFDRHDIEQAFAARATGPYLVEAYFRGDGVGLSVVARDGVVLHAYQHRRIEQQGEAGASTYRISEPCDRHLLRAAQRLAAATRLSGVAMFEFRQDRSSGRYVLLEVNPRFWGSLPLAIAAGADFPLLLHDMLEGRPRASPVAYHSGIRKLDLTHAYFGLAERLGSLRTNGDLLAAASSASRVAVALIFPNRCDSWAPDDPLPWRAERRFLLRHIAGALRRRLPFGSQSKPSAQL